MNIILKLTIKNKLLAPKRLIMRIIRGCLFFKLGYTTCTWDYTDFFEVMQFQLKGMDKDAGFDIFVGSEKVRRNIKICKVLCDRLANDEDNLRPYYDDSYLYFKDKFHVKQEATKRERDAEYLFKTLSKNIFKFWW